MSAPPSRAPRGSLLCGAGLLVWAAACSGPAAPGHPSPAHPSASVAPAGSPSAAASGAPARPAALPGLDPGAPRVLPAALAAALAGPLADRGLGSDPAALVVDAAEGTVLLDRHGDGPLTPASTVKLLTAAAALVDLGPSTRLRTRVLGAPPGPGPGGEVWLVGAGDPSLQVADAGYPYPGSLDALATALAAGGVRAVARVRVDASLFTGATTAPGWKPGYVTGNSVSPVSALEVADGHLPPLPTATGRSTDPAATAATLFVDALRRHGVTVAGAPAAGSAPAGLAELAAVTSPPVGVLVEQMLAASDNDLAESLGRLVARAENLPADFAGAATAVGRVAARLGMPTTGLALSDASGLSVDDRAAPRTLLEALRLSLGPGHPELRPIADGLAVAGLDGTLANRYRAGPEAAAAGRVRAKTGTLAGVSAVIAEVTTADGRLLLVAGYALGPPSRPAGEAALDRLVAVVAACGCR